MTDNPYRLPRTTVPRHYELMLEPDLETYTFTGNVDIELDISEPVDLITLNAVDLELSGGIVSSGGATTTVTSVSYDEAMQRATLHLESPVRGDATLSLAFVGTLNDQLHGFYRSSYLDVDGNRQTIATTQFEATDARRAFPCFDEPGFKATYSVTLVVDDGLLAVSNSSAIERAVRDDGKIVVRFAPTMKMSSYLVAMVVGPFEATDAIDVDGIPLRVITPKGKLHLADFALECGAFCLRYLADYYGIAYPGDKVDLVGIPDFAFGAMENLGCITFRESALLVDPATAGQGELIRILDVVAHELAHMWFGDLVTMEWWDGIWLNEAFASFMEMKATDAMRPEWKRWVAFGASERPWGFAVDALATTRPVEFKVGSPEEANEMFDALTYGKGSSVLRMIEQFLGEEVFRQGVGDYLREHAYGNTTTSDLWEGLDRASGTDVGSIMDTWILQGGYPQLEVSVDGRHLKVSQRRYLSIPDETDQTSWRVPVQLRGRVGGEPYATKLVLSEPSVALQLPGDVEWLTANAGGHGFYRVVYDAGSFERLTRALGELVDLERFVLVDDAWAFAESGLLGVSEYLDIAGSYIGETEHAIWTTIAVALSSISHHAVEESARPAFRRLVAELTGPRLAALGWDPAPDENDLTRRLRGLILGMVGRLAEDPDVIQRSKVVARSWISSPTGVDPDVAQSALFTWATRGDMETLETLYQAYGAAKTPQSELKVLQAIALVDEDAAVDRTIAAILDGTVRSQDAAWVVARLMSGRESGPHAWTTLRSKWPEITSKMPPATLRRVVEGIPALSLPEVATDVEAFFAELDLPVVAKTISQNLEKLRINRMLRERETTRLTTYLETR
jgi:puromycin-sensitive aminopeptidase